MGQAKTTIELNGKLYDASTGAMVSRHTAAAPTKVPKGGVVDGFFRAANRSNASITMPQPKAAASIPVLEPGSSRRQRHERGIHHAGRKPEHTHTLMRHAVQKPKITAPVILPAKPKQPTVPKHKELASEREQRAATAPKSSSVSRFSFAKSSSVSKKVAHLPVRPHPAHQAAAESHNIAPVTAPPLRSAASQSANSTSGHMSFSHALANAHSHEQAPLKAKKLRQRTAKKLGVSSRALSITASALIITILAGFAAYQNSANISMRLASTRAGFHASLPGYVPGGFGLAGPIQSNPGVVTVSFRSHTDGRNYTVTQKPSDWTSEALRSNFFNSGDTPVAYQDRGRTIYIYGDGTNAAWVNAGVLYQISGDSNLGTSQLLSIASSI